MHSQTLGKRLYAFGLKWIADREGAADDIESAVEADGAPRDSYVYLVKQGGTAKAKGSRKKRTEPTPAAKTGVVGYFVSEDKVKAIYSAAAAVAMLGRDGLYVGQLSNDQWWYCGIREGLVIPDTDVVGDPDAIQRIALTMREGLDMPVFMTPGIDLAGGEVMDLWRLLADSKSSAMRLLSSHTSPLVPIIAVVVLAGLGWLGYRAMAPAQPKLTPEQQQALLRQTYIASVSSELKSLPLNGGWVIGAYEQAVRSLPPYFAGWTLEGVTCTPKACTGMYVVDRLRPFALSPLNDRFGTAAIHVMTDAHSAQVALPLPTTVVSVSEGWLRQQRPAASPFLDWVGTVPLTMAGATIDGQLLQNDLSRKFGGDAAGMPPLVEEQASVKQEAFIDLQTLGGIAAAGSRGGFVPVQFAWSFGNGSVAPTWRMTWARIHG